MNSIYIALFNSFNITPDRPGIYLKQSQLRGKHTVRQSIRRSKTSNPTISCTVYIGYPFDCRLDRRDARNVPKVLTRFEPGTSHIASECSHHSATAPHNDPMCKKKDHLNFNSVLLKRSLSFVWTLRIL